MRNSNQDTTKVKDWSVNLRRSGIIFSSLVSAGKPGIRRWLLRSYGKRSDRLLQNLRG